jgi:hypothetical protein
MMRGMVDASSETVLATLTLVTGDVTLPALRTTPCFWPVLGWVVQVKEATATGGIYFVLEVATLASGPWIGIAVIPWPAGETQPRQLLAGVYGGMVRAANPQAQYVRVRVETTPPQPGIVFASWLTMTGSVGGIAARAGDQVAS